MNITKEEFYKLPQLDRIEYRQRLDYLNNNKLEGNAFTFLWQMLMITAFIIVIALLFYNINSDATYKLINILPGIGRIIGVGTAILVLIDILGIVIHKREIRKLDREYFNIVSKKVKK